MLRIGPVAGLGALRHDDDERPALGVVAHCLGKADLRLPHALGAALAAAMKKENDGPLLVVVAPPLFRQIDLEAVGDAVQLDAAIEEAGLLRQCFRCGAERSLAASARGLSDERQSRKRGEDRRPEQSRKREHLSISIIQSRACGDWRIDDSGPASGTECESELLQEILSVFLAIFLRFA